MVSQSTATGLHQTKASPGLKFRKSSLNFLTQGLKIQVGASSCLVLPGNDSKPVDVVEALPRWEDQGDVSAI